MFSLAKKSVMVTGGGSGIGKAIASLFAGKGAFVNVLDFDSSAAQLVVQEIQDSGGRAAAYCGDVRNQKEVQAVFQKIGDLDILVNNAGVAHIGKVHTTNEEDFYRVFEVNVKGVYHCLHAAIPLFLEKGKGVVLNMASVAASVGIADRFAYSMSKGAVVAMTQSVAKDYLTDHIRCNSISPARIHTSFVDGFLKQNYPGQEKEMFGILSKTQPLGRMGTPGEVAALALFLCSDEAAFITGCDYPIDGGFIKLNT